MSQSVARSGGAETIQSAQGPRQRDNSVKESVSSAISKAADKRLESLSAGSTQEYLQAAEKLINATLPSKPPGTKLRINLDDDSGRFVYQGVDVNTGDVITQFPAEEVLKFLSYIREKNGLEGIVVDETA
ncbi:flagellar protein FlaG [Paremcibacter congregatus]|uniref:flagellar protein FlaG n=1 Tax=Paremcibacter congregatus TaxID=2043170 RepID=UPI0013FDDF89|nr:flagellar protein FlaG [Paremcibacter congregatus]